MRKYLHVVQESEAEKILRFVNYLIDYLIVYAFFFLFGIVGGLLTYVGVYFLYDLAIQFSEVNRVIDYIVTNTVYFLYIFCIENFTKGRSLGEYITGTKVVMIDGETPTTRDFFIRNISRLVPFDGLSFLGSLGWHDNWSDTRVVKIKTLQEKQLRVKEIESLGKKEIE